MPKRKIAAADCETDPFKHGRMPRPFLWGIYDGETYHEFTTTKDFIEFIKDKDWIIYAHNGGKFDWHFLADEIEPYQKLMLIGGRISRVKIGACELRDSWNLFPIPLAAYQKTEIDYNKFEESERSKPENWREIRNYLRDDCVFLYQLLERFINDYGLNLTLAGSALKYWRNNFYDGGSFSGNQYFHERFKKFYYGGRVECFTKGIIDKKFKVFDINSAYPFAMLHNHPWDYSFRKHKNIPEKLENCFFTVEGISRGAFPYRGKYKLDFPTDKEKRVYHITGWELKAALELNAFNGKVLECYEFGNTINFTDYVNHFYKMKAECKDKDKAGYLMAKLFMNSLYGKFCANPEKYSNYELIENQFIKTSQENENKCFYAPFGRDKAIMQSSLSEAEMQYYNIATGASVTGFVRAFLFRHLSTCDSPLYCDTDSIACVDASFDIGKNLGEWECEGEFIRGAIAGKKMYAFQKENGEYKKATKGVKLSPQEIFKVASGEEVLYKNEAPTFSIANGAHFIERKISLT